MSASPTNSSPIRPHYRHREALTHPIGLESPPTFASRRRPITAGLRTTPAQLSNGGKDAARELGGPPYRPQGRLQETHRRGLDPSPQKPWVSSLGPALPSRDRSSSPIGGSSGRSWFSAHPVPACASPEHADTDQRTCPDALTVCRHLPSRKARSALRAISGVRFARSAKPRGRKLLNPGSSTADLACVR